MKIDPKEPVVVIQVEIFGERGSKVVEMVLDTGATYTMIPWKVAESLGYDPASSRNRVNIVTASSTEIVPLITLKSIKALGFSVDNLQVACHDLPPKSRVDGLLGLNFLKNFDVDLHFKTGVLEFKE
ncbi:MAG: retroviral-like aspartic protease family protein [candidate division Zixibacteria bacterium]|nr:retroviral-like aspartic protease family protein [candidate division Zixibacteria bacterium]